MKCIQRMISSCLTAAILIGMLPITAWATESETPIETNVLTETTVMETVQADVEIVSAIEKASADSSTEPLQESTPTEATIPAETEIVATEEVSDNLDTNETLETYPITNEAASVENTAGEFAYTVLNGTYCEVTGYTGTKDSITIPSEIDGYIVQRIANFAFCENTVLKAITLPDSVIEIGEYAFSGCTGLTEIAIPENVETISNYAFEDCTNLTKVTIPANVTNMGMCVFDDSTKLKTAGPIGGGYNVEYGWTESIPQYAFNSFHTLTSIILPEELEEISDGGFADCDALESITIPENVTRIGNDAFSSCDSLKTVIMTDGAVSIGDNAFNNCKALTTIHLSEGLETIGRFAFVECISLKGITLPGSVIEIGEYAFSGCTGLTEIAIPENVETISNYAFEDCTNLTKVTIPANVTNMGMCVFDDSTKLKTAGPIGGGYNVEYGWTESIPQYAFNSFHTLTSIILPEELEEISDGGFADCDALESITIPENVTRIGNDAFSSCDSLKTVIMTDGVVSIGNNAFNACTALKEITLPDSVMEIGEYAFYRCAALREIILPEEITMIGNYAFQGCEGLIEFTVPEGIKIIGYGTFADCINLRKVCLPASVTDLAYDAFENTSLETVIVSAEDSTTAILLVDQEIPFITAEQGIKDQEDRYLDRSNTKYYIASSSGEFSEMIPFAIEYDFKDSAKLRVTELELKIRIPSIEFIAANSLTVNGEAVEYEENEGVITLPLTDASGAIKFGIEPQDASYMATYAQITYKIYGEYRTETIGIITSASEILTIDVPGESSSPVIEATGSAQPNQSVEIYIDGVYYGKTTTSESGNYSQSIILPKPEDGKTYKIEARITTSDGSEITAMGQTTFDSNAVKLTAFKMYYRNDEYNLISIGSKRPVISWMDGETFVFTIDFDDCSKVDEVKVVSSKGNVENELTAVYDKDNGYFVAAGFENYVPGVIKVLYRQKEEMPEPFAHADVQFDSAGQTEEGVYYRQCRITIADEERTSFLYFEEYEEDCEFTITDNMYYSVYKGNPSYITIEPEVLYRNGGCFYVREMYMKQDDGSYDRMRIGYGDYFTDEAEASYSYVVQAISYTAASRKNDYEEQLKKLQYLEEKLLEAIESGDQKKIAKALRDFIQAAKQMVEPGSEEWNDLVALETKLRLAGLCNMTDIFRWIRQAIDISFSSADDPWYTLPNQMEDKFNECVDTIEDKSDEVENSILQDIIDELVEDSDDDENDSLIDLINNFIIKKFKESDEKFNGKYAIDPSGYVYEAVDANRLSGVKTTIYYRETMESESILWNAAEYEQENPLYTDELGWYAWDVPEGFWQVKYEKEGYETTYSDWLEVPPPQLNVNIGMVSTDMPKVDAVYAASDKIEIVFSQYIDVKTVTLDTIQIQNSEGLISGTLNAVEAKVCSYNSDLLVATTFCFTPDEELSGNLTVKVAKVENYIGKAMTDIFSQTVNVKTAIREVSAPESIELVFKDKQLVTVQGLPEEAVAGKKLLLTVSNLYIAEVDSTATFNEEGQASFYVTSIAPGQTEILYQIDETTQCGTIEVCSLSKKTAKCTHKWSEDVVVIEPTQTSNGERIFTCIVCGEQRTEIIPILVKDPEVEDTTITRIAGSGRVQTALESAKQLKALLGVDKFQSIVVADARNFPDALSGSYLAAVAKAPILLYADNQTAVTDYVKENLASGGTVYILGGTSSVSDKLTEALPGIHCERVAGSGRFGTSLDIIRKGDEILGRHADKLLVCTGASFADSLSASATGLPILLVNGTGDTIRDDHKAYLETLSGVNIYVIGGKNTVNDTMLNLFSAYDADGTVERVSGSGRAKTSVAVAEAFFPEAKTATLALSTNFPDGLSGGPVAYTLGAPLLLISDGQEAAAADYVAERGIKTGYIFGGTSSVSDDTANKVFGK